jgi:Pentapeptide repeats (8 copies)
MHSLFAKTKAFLSEHGIRLLGYLILVAQVVFAVAVYYFATHITEVKVKVPEGTHWWTPWIPALAALIVTAGALITLYTNKRVSERHFELQALESERHFDRQALESLFTDILNRFAAENPIIRANAAIRLGEIVRKNWPGTPTKKTPDNYPFFPDATSQLAAALHMEDNQAVRNEIVKALARTTDFAKQDDQALLHLLISELSDCFPTSRLVRTAQWLPATPWQRLYALLLLPAISRRIPTQRMQWKRAVPLELNGCFLANANLFNAQLQGADLQLALLQGAMLVGTQLQRASLKHAECQGALLIDAQPQGTYCWRLGCSMPTSSGRRCRRPIFDRPISRGRCCTGPISLEQTSKEPDSLGLVLRRGPNWAF